MVAGFTVLSVPGKTANTSDSVDVEFRAKQKTGVETPARPRRCESSPSRWAAGVDAGRSRRVQPEMIDSLSSDAQGVSQQSPGSRSAPWEPLRQDRSAGPFGIIPIEAGRNRHGREKQTLQWMSFLSTWVIHQVFPAGPPRTLASPPTPRTTAFLPRHDSIRVKPSHQGQPALFVASRNHNQPPHLGNIVTVPFSCPLF
jgi:hypothetical protein